MRLVYDTEGDGLRDQCTRLWCIVAKDIDNGTVYKYGPDEISEGICKLGEASELICHNQIDHDLPILQIHYGWTPDKRTKITDTLVLSRAIWPDREPNPAYKGNAPHSVEAYGVKFKRKKPEHEDWSYYSTEMLHRCSEDVEIQHRIYDFLCKEAKEKGFPDFSWRLEHEVAKIMTQQEINGFPFDIEKAKQYINDIKEIQSRIYQEVRPALGFAINGDSDPKHIKQREISRPFSPDGSLSKKLQKLCGDELMNPDEIGGKFTYVDINIGSRNVVIECLYRLGWEPNDDEWNFKKDKSGKVIKGRDGRPIRSSPKLTDKGKPVRSLLEIEGSFGKGLARWFILSHRRSQITGWIERVRDDGRMSAGANPCGANTSRMKHRNVVNVPKANADNEGNLIWDIDQQSEVFGTQMRSLFIAPYPWVLVGHDASGLEARMLAHYLQDDKLTHEILHGDFHTLIWNTINEFVHSRSNAKNVEYAFIYGAGDNKLGTMADDRNGMSPSKCGAVIRESINKGIPAIGDLTKRVQKEAERGYVSAIDGRKLFIRSSHSALNTLFQGSGAIVMKTSMIYLKKWADRERLKYEKVLDMHDEAQHLLIPEHAELFGEFAVQSIRTAGKYLGVRCPLDAEYKIGANWAETH